MLAGIAPAALRREHLTHSLVNKASLEPRHPLHNLVQTSNSVRQRLPSRRPFSRHATTLSSSNFNMLEAWRTRWQEIQPPAQFTVQPNTSMPPGAELARREWVTLNRLRTGVGRFSHNMKRWGLRPSAACTCGHPDQTAHHVIHDCPTLSPPESTNINLTNPNLDTVNWLRRLNQIA